MTSEIILYQTDDLPERIEVRLEDDTVWLNQEQLSSLFQRDQSVISRHIRNVFKEGELEEKSNMQKMHIPNSDKPVAFYNLNVIISVGYRVKSKQGTQFRIWATNVLRDYMLKGYALNQRMNRIENSVESLTNKVQKIDFQIKSKDLPEKGLFFEGQIFDAYQLVTDIIQSAQSSVILIDNYIDSSVLTLLSKRKKEVDCTIYTKKITKGLQLDLKKHNQQYPSIELKALKTSHDRFLVIDEKERYHIGASLKDLGKKWFGFSRMDSLCIEVLNKLKPLNQGG
ncbi:MAG TPA: RhuM family protein [Flavobacteriaceae bacterium]|nr:RhuM family protein [Flavobacteriaceae bacterium]